MISIGVTGSIASGKSTVSRLMAGKKYPLFSADKVVTDLYKKKSFINSLVKKFKLNKKSKVKDQLRLLLKNNKKNFKKLEKTIHPLVRKEMKKYLKKKNKIVIFEIPLLIEGKLNKYFDALVYVGSKKNIRLRRYLKKGGKKQTFYTLDKRQLSPKIKEKVCDYKITNNKSLVYLKKQVKNFIKKYE
ncbi:MAG: dephospho-CoA kinase [Pelagibacteraceae bacterium]